MQKTTTLKDFKVFLLKTFLAIFVLSMSFLVSSGQSMLEPQKKNSSQLRQQTVTPLSGPKELAKDNRSLVSPVLTSTDVPAMNQMIAEKLAKRPTISTNIVRNNTPTTNIINDVCVFNGSLAAGDGQIANRITRNGVASTCAAPKPGCPGTNGTGPVYYDSYTMQNLTCASQCVSVTYENIGGDGDVFVVAYNGTFNNANVCQNYIADGGGSVPPGFPPVTYSFTLAPNATVVFVAAGVGNLTPMTAYRFTVTGINCAPPPPCTPIGPSVLSQTQYPAPPVNLVNESFNASTVFPASGLPATWLYQMNSQPPGLITVWYSGVQAGVFGPNSGADYIAGNYNHAGAALGTLSSWMFVPPVLLRNGDKFTFYTRHDPGNARPDRLQVRSNTTNNGVNVGATATSVGDFTNLLLDINPTYQTTGYPTVWTQYTVTMSGLPPAGFNGRLAFRYFCENSGGVGVGINSDYIGIDDAVYTTFPTINPTTCPGSTTCLNVAIAGGNPGATYNVTINANPGGNFTVNGYTSGNCIPVTPAVNTTYTLVSVIDASNPCCIGTGNSGTPTVVVTPGPITGLQITANPNPPICSGDPTLLTVSGLPGSASFTSAPITINAFGNATPYPQTLAVAGLPAGATVSSVRLNQFNHTWAGDIDVALCGPTYVAGGQVQTAMLLSDLGNDGFIGATNVNLTFQDGAPRVPTTSPMVSGTYSCTNDGAVTDAMPLPGPTTTVLNPLLTQLNAATMNGTWNMYIYDQVGGDGGSVAGGYTINFTWPAAPPVGYTFLWSPAAGLSSTTGNPVAASPPVTRQYTVLGTAPGGCQTAATILITVNQLPAVVTNPTAVTLCDGGTATFTVGATGAGINYQWQVGTSATGPWTPLNNAAPYAGVTTATLTINPATVALNGNWYRCVISGTCPPNANSAAAKLTVNPLPTVTIAPASPVCGGVPGINGTALTASGATGGYTWAPFAGLYTSNTTTPANAYTGTNLNPVYAAPAVNTIYTVTGTNAGTGCTNTATVNVVYTPPAPTVNPASVTMCNGDPAVQLCVTSSLAPSPFTATFNSGPIANFPLISTVAAGGNNAINCSALPTTAQITAIRVKLNVTHTWVGDCSFVLKAPNGKIIDLDWFLNGTGGTGATTGFTNTVISSTGVNALSTGTNPYTGTFKADLRPNTNNPAPGPTAFPVNTLLWSDMFAGNPSGNWTLAGWDAFAGDDGNVNDWSISFDYLYGPPAAGTWSPATGLYTDAAATIPYVAGTPSTCVYARPLPFGVYPYQVTVQSVGFDAVPVFSNPNLVDIRDNNTANPYPSTITVSGVPAGATIENVKLNGFTHTWSGDVDVAITDPGGAGVILFSDLYGDALIGATNVNLTFSDLASGPIPNVSPMVSGTYQCSNFGTPDNFPAPGPQLNQPNPSLSLLNGRPRNGTWSLWVIDQVGGDFGSINNGWSISFRYPTPGCTSPPRTVVVTVNTQPIINAQPASTAVCTDKVATFTVGATIGLGTFTYQWQVSNDNGNTYNDITNGGVYSGATTATLTITRPPVTMNGYVYRCKLQGPAPCAPVYSFFRILTVYPLPTITITAAPYVKLFPGLRTVLSSTVSPYAAASYTWLRNGIAVSGGNTQSLNVDIDGLGDYTLRVTDVNGCTNISNTLSITDSVSSNCFLYPNPSSGKFQVRYYSVPGNVLPRTLTVYDAKGSRVLTQTFTITAPYARMDLDLTPFGKGVFWVELGDRNGSRIIVCRAVVD